VRKHARLIRRGGSTDLVILAWRRFWNLVTYLRGAPNKSIEPLYACLRILIFLIELADKSNWTESALTLTTMNPSCKGELAELSTKGRHRLSSARL
jgi:hypothetical protein